MTTSMATGVNGTAVLVRYTVDKLGVNRGFWYHRPHIRRLVRFPDPNRCFLRHRYRYLLLQNGILRFTTISTVSFGAFFYFSVVLRYLYTYLFSLYFLTKIEVLAPARPPLLTISCAVQSIRADLRWSAPRVNSK